MRHRRPVKRGKQIQESTYMPAEGGRRRDGGPAVQIGHLIAVLFRIITYRIRFNCMDGVRLKIVNRAIIKAPSVCLENLSRPLGIQRAAQILVKNTRWLRHLVFFTRFFLSFVGEYLSIPLRGSQHIAPMQDTF